MEDELHDPAIGLHKLFHYFPTYFRRVSLSAGYQGSTGVLAKMKSLTIDRYRLGCGDKMSVKRVITLTLLFTNAYFGIYFLARLLMRG